MFPCSTLHNIAYCAFADTEAPPELRYRVLAGGIQGTNFLNLFRGKPRASVSFALQRSIVEADVIRMGCVFGMCAVFEIIKSVVSFIAILMVDLYIIDSYAKRRGRRPDEDKRNEDMNRLEMALAVFTHSYHVVPALAAIRLAYLTRLSSPCRIDSINRADTPEGGCFVDSFVSRYRFPYFHSWPPIALFCYLYYTILLNTCDWKAASERTKQGSIAASLVHNRMRFGIDDQLAAILENTVRELGW